MNLKIFELSTVDMTLYKFVLPLMKELREHNYKVICGAQDLGYLQRIESEGFTTYPLPIKRNLNPIMLIKSLIQLIKIFQKEEVDILHVHTPIASIIGRLAARLAGVPIKVYTVHGFIVKPRYYYWIEKYMAKYFTSHLFTVSQEDAQFAIEHEFISRENITSINSVGIDTTFFNPNLVTLGVQNSLRSHYNIGDNDIIIGFVGRIVREKGILDLIHAYSSIKNKQNTKLLLVGPVDLDERKQNTIDHEIKQLIRENQLEGKVIMTGHQENIRDLLSIMNIFVLPSYREGMPISLLEAMAMEKAVIGTNIRGIREEIDDSCGIIYPKGDISQLKSAIEEYIKDPKIMEQKSKNARQRAVQYFEESLVIKRQMEIFNNYNNLQ